MSFGSCYSSCVRWLVGCLLCWLALGHLPAAGQTRQGGRAAAPTAAPPGYRLRTLYDANRPDEQRRDTGFVGLHQYYRLSNAKLTALRRGGYAGSLFGQFRHLLLAHWIHDSIALQGSFTGPLPFRGNLLEAPPLEPGSDKRMTTYYSDAQNVRLLVTPRHDSLLQVRVTYYLDVQHGEIEVEGYWFGLRGGRVLLLNRTWYDTTSSQRPAPLARVMRAHGRRAEALARQQVRKPYKPADMRLESVYFDVNGLQVRYELCRPTPEDRNEDFKCDGYVSVILPYRELDPALFFFP